MSVSVDVSVFLSVSKMLLSLFQGASSVQKPAQIMFFLILSLVMPQKLHALIGQKK